MDIKKIRAKLDIYANGLTKYNIEITQGDINSNEINLELFKNGTPFNVTDVAKANISFTRPDGVVITGVCIITDAVNGKLSYTLGTSEIAIVGQVVVSLSLEKIDKTRLTFNNFSFNVRQDMMGAKVIESFSEFAPLVQLTQRVEGLEATAEILNETLNNSISAANTATNDANTATDEALSAADTALNRANLAEEKATLAQTKANLADEKATLADQKAQAAQTATDAANVAAAAYDAATKANTVVELSDSRTNAIEGKNYVNLRDRLDKEKQEVTTLLAENTNTIISITKINHDYKGVNIAANQPGDYLTPKIDTLIDYYKTHGIEYVAVTTREDMATYISNEFISKVPIDEIQSLIQKLHLNGLKVMLKPHIDCLEGTTRSNYNPSDPALWLQNYKNLIIQYANLANQENVEILCIGTELINQTKSTYLSNWQDIISNIRAIYTGKLTYSCMYDEKDTLCFWNLLDYAGINLYTPLTSKPNPSLKELYYAWQQSRFIPNYLQSLRTWQQSINKPVIMTEAGYISITGTNMSPYTYAGETYEYNETEQANCYDVFFRVISGEEWCKGIFWWADTGYTANEEKSYSFVNKKAGEVVERWWY